jgi:hypothetical protein
MYPELSFAENIFEISGLIKIQRALGILEGFCANGMRINHGRSNIAVPQQFLNGTNIKIRLE